MIALDNPGEIPLTFTRLHAVAKALQGIGWTLTVADLDSRKLTARLQFRRDDLLVTFDVNKNKASTTRERLRRTVVRVGRRGDFSLVERVTTELVGRERHEGARSGLRWLADYLADNGANPTHRIETRNAVRWLFSE